MVEHNYWCIKYVNEYEEDSYYEFFEGSQEHAEKYAYENCPSGYIIYGVFDYPHPDDPDGYWGNDPLGLEDLPDWVI